MAITTLGAALIGGGLLGSAALSSNASNKAGKTVSAATDRAADLQNQQFEKLLGLQMPAYNRGEQAAGLYGAALGIPNMMTGGGVAGTPGTPGTPNTADIPGLVMTQPGYQAQLDQGLKAIDRAAPLAGGMYSGRRMKALNDFGQQTFGSYYQNWMDRVGGVAGQGAQTAQNIGQAGMQNANNVGNLWMTGANARANAGMNSANAWTSAIGTGIGLFGGAKGWI